MNARVRNVSHVCVLLLLCGMIAACQQCAYAEDKAQGDESAFVSLFNGRDLTGWTGNTKQWSVDNGVLVCRDGSGNIFSEREFADFELRCEFRLAAGANNGIGLRAPKGAKWVSSEGIEIQILDDSAPKYAALKPYQYHGSIYGFVPAERGALKPVGQWNEQQIHCVGQSIVITLNGKRIIDSKLADYEVDPAPDGLARPGLKRTKGHLALLGHSERAEFRNLRVREIETAKPLDR